MLRRSTALLSLPRTHASWTGSSGHRSLTSAAHATARRDPHAVLGVVPGCSKDDLKAAYHRRTWALHPDLRPAGPSRDAAEVAFKELSEAYRGLMSTSVCWPFATHARRPPKPRYMEQYQSIFVEFWGVRRRVRERTWPHVLRAALCDRLCPTGGRP